MPRVPTITARQVAPQGPPGVNIPVETPLEAFGGGAVAGGALQSIGRLAQGIGEYVRQEQDKANRVKLLEAEVELGTFETDLLHNSQTGALGKRGRDTFGILDTTLKSWNSRADEIEKGLGNEIQREAFGRIRASRQADLNSQLQRHMASEQERYSRELTESFLANEKEAAVKSGDAERVEVSIGRQKAALAVQAEREGLSDEWLKLRTSQAVSETRREVIRNLVDGGNDLLAGRYLEAHKGDLRADDASFVSELVRKGSIRGESQRQEDRIITMGLGQEESLDEARKIKDPEIRDATVNRVKDRLAEEREIQRESENALFAQAWNAGLGDIPQSLLQSLTPAHQKVIEDRQSDLRRGKKPQTDSEKLTRFMGLSQQELAGYSESRMLSEFRPFMDDEDYGSALRRWNAAKESARNPKANAEFKSIFSDEQAIFDAAVSLNLGGITAADTAKTIGKKKSKYEPFLRFRQDVDDSLKSFFHSNGRNPNDEEKREIIDTLAIRSTRTVSLKRYDLGVDWLDSDETRRIADLTQEEIETEEFDIPEDVRARAYNLARSSGVIPNSMPRDVFEETFRGQINRAFIKEVLSR